MTCGNMVTIDARFCTGNLVPRSCIPYTRDSFYAMIDYLAEQRTILNSTDFKALQTDLGINYDSRGLFFDQSIRTIIDPSTCLLRDWMHALVCNGVVGTEIAMFIPRMQAVEPTWSMDTLQTYARCWNQPKRYGRIRDHWFDLGFLQDHKTQYFASEEVAMLRLLCSFVEDVIKPTGKLEPETTSICMMDKIVKMLLLGPDMPLTLVESLESLIFDHHRLYLVIYPKKAIKGNTTALCTSQRRLGHSIGICRVGPQSENTFAPRLPPLLFSRIWRKRR